jgi:glyoxylase-like metal-dependent hydrolase (beta-lactamase superfamily II)
MGAKRVINGVHVVPMGMANAFLIEGDDGLTLIDAGFSGKEAAVFQAIRGLGRSPDQLKHLIFTHGHPDHIGSAAAVVRETSAKTHMHPLDIPMAESGGPFRPMRPAPGLLGQVLCRLFFDPDERMEPVAIDQALSDGEILPIAGGIEGHPYSWALRGTRRTAVASGTKCCSRAMCASSCHIPILWRSHCTLIVFFTNFATTEPSCGNDPSS